MVSLTYSQVQQLAQLGSYTTIPLSCEILSDMKTPMEVLRILKNVSDHVFMLESVTGHESQGRYTFLGFDPKLSIVCRNGQLRVGDDLVSTDDPNQHIRRIMAQYVSPAMPDLPPFTGGLVGFMAYDYLKYAEPTLRLVEDDADVFNDIDLMLFDKVIAFDTVRQKIILIANMQVASGEEGYNAAVRDLQRMVDLVSFGEPAADPGLTLKSEFTPLFNKDQYCTMVEQAKHHIKEGDIFQVVLSNRLEAQMEGSLLDAYRILRTVNPSPYMFYFSGTDLEVAGASPETLVKLENGVLHTFPLAGTRPRGKTPAEDQALETELLADAKELSEHNMLVDLGRNDIGKVSAFGTVEVEEYCQVHRYSHVMHIGSTVAGRIAEGKDALDAISAILPAGTLSGAPKIRACQIINQLEGDKRGIYGGGIGYFDMKGNMDMCIAIRIAYRQGNRVFVRSGAGIVADSVPESEFQECLNKAAAVITSIKQAEGLAKGQVR